MRQTSGKVRKKFGKSAVRIRGFFVGRREVRGEFEGDGQTVGPIVHRSCYIDLGRTSDLDLENEVWKKEVKNADLRVKMTSKVTSRGEKKMEGIAVHKKVNGCTGLRGLLGEKNAFFVTGHLGYFAWRPRNSKKCRAMVEINWLGRKVWTLATT